MKILPLAGAALLLALLSPAPAAVVKPVFASAVVGKEVVDIDVDVTGALTLALVVNEGGNGYGADWADWIEPTLTGPAGDVKLATLPWKSATAGWGEVRIDKNAAGGAMNAGGQPVRGLGTHAHSVIQYDLAGRGFTRFRARAGGDKGGTDQGGTSVRFLVFALKADDQLPRSALGSKSSGAQAGADTVEGMEVADGVEATLWASEPMLSNPTDIDVDARGRVWVCEAVNYRGWAGNVPEGDRIVLLEDTDHDGRADTSTVFYQGKDIDAALGICVLGNRVIVSRSPHVFAFYDDNDDGKADRKEVLFSGISGEQHDHAMHAFTFGPDGKLYFNFGNAGGQLKHADGTPVVDQAGHEVSSRGQPYRQGMVFRCNPDGSQVETLAWNFRNNYEVAVDSFGTLWQSDNDDDGNQGVRINYVMEFGNYGYSDELTGAGWNQARANLEPEIPRRHWHLNDPGVVPNLLQTGAGSPAGITVYEGELLPAVFRNQVLHCDPGPRVVRAYPVTSDGAGYRAVTQNLVTANDNWFRPSDVAVMPDGSVVVADWYDPGVGGHAMGDNKAGQTHGRLYRIAPPGHKPGVSAPDLSKPIGAAVALCSPNYATRYLAWMRLKELGAEAVPALTRLWTNPNPRLRARALWLLGRVAGQEDQWIAAALADREADIRIVGLRLARGLGRDVPAAVRAVVKDPSAAVRREAAIALRGCTNAAAPALWAELARQHDGADRWYLEALGIGAAGRDTEFLGVWLQAVGAGWNTPAGRDIVWRSRGAQTPGLLADVLLDPGMTATNCPRYVRALDFQKAGPEKDAALIRLLGSPLVASEAAERLSFARAKGHEADIARALEGSKGTLQFVELVQRFQVPGREGELLQLALAAPPGDAAIAAARALLATGQEKLLADALSGEQAVAAAQALGLANDRRVLPLLEPLAVGSGPAALRGAAVEAMARIELGAQRLLQLARDGTLPAETRAQALGLLAGAAWPDVQSSARQLAPSAPAPVLPLPPVSELAKRSGDAAKGQGLFMALCMSCHRVGPLGVNYGPALTEIGGKLGKDGLYQAILEPSAGIAFGYETVYLKFSTGDSAFGLLVSETADDIVLKSVGGLTTRYAKRDLAGREQWKTSSMPELGRTLPAESLADVVEYLLSLKHK